MKSLDNDPRVSLLIARVGGSWDCQSKPRVKKRPSERGWAGGEVFAKSEDFSNDQEGERAERKIASLSAIQTRRIARKAESAFLGKRSVRRRRRAWRPGSCLGGNGCSRSATSIGNCARAWLCGRKEDRFVSSETYRDRCVASAERSSSCRTNEANRMDRGCLGRTIMAYLNLG